VKAGRLTVEMPLVWMGFDPFNGDALVLAYEVALISGKGGSTWATRRKIWKKSFWKCIRK